LGLVLGIWVLFRPWIMMIIFTKKSSSVC
jgi:hypothetical protein